RRICPFRNFDHDGFVAPNPIEILVKLETQLPGMHSYRAVFEGTVSRRLMKNRFPNVLLSQFMAEPADGLLGDVLQQVAQSATLLKWRIGHNPLNELPSLITEGIIDDNRPR